MTVRSLLFLPASRPERFSKALASNADIVILDLEDGVDPLLRSEARKNLTEIATRNFDGAAARIYVRISSLNEVDGLRDMTSLLDWPHLPRGLMLCKVQTAAEVLQVASLTRTATKEKECTLELLPIVESAKGVAAADTIAESGTVLAGMAFGSADYTQQTTGTLSRDSLLGPRGRIVNAAAIARTVAIDGAWLDIDDLEGLELEARHALDLGFGGKVAIHPKQVDTINKVFTPTKEQLVWANRVLAEAELAGSGAFKFEGQMIDGPILDKARQTLARAG